MLTAAQACQSENWKSIHRHECKIFQGVHPNVLPGYSRAVLKLILYKRHFQDTHGDRIQRFESLECHLKNTIETKPAHFEKLVLSARAIREYSKTDLGLQEIVEHFIRVR